MNQKFALIILILSALFSSWLFWGSDVKIEQILTSREWQTNIDTFVLANEVDETIGPIQKIYTTSNIKYLPNGDYLRETRMQIFNKEDNIPLTMNISETGRWELSDRYLLVEPTKFKDTSTSESKEFTTTQLRMIKQVFMTEAQQSRRVEIIDDNSILLTNLGHSSRILVSTP